MRKLWVLGLLGMVFAGCGGDDDDGGASGGGGDECDGVDTAELEEIWGDVEANPIGGMCSILVADGEAIRLTKADAAGDAGYQELVDGVIGAENGEQVDIGDQAEVYTGTSAGDVYVVAVGDAAFKIAAVDLPRGQMEATARSIADNL